MDDFTFLGVGWSYPIKADIASGQIELSQYDKDVLEAIRIILHTSKGERLMRPSFGSSLSMFVFLDMSLSTLSRIAEDVKNSLIMWEARIQDVEVEVKPTESKGRIDINVSYSIRMTNNRYNVVFPYYLDEGNGYEL